MSGDLHCHTKLSDGTLGLEELIALAAKRGIETIAITDHDCLAGTKMFIFLPIFSTVPTELKDCVTAMLRQEKKQVSS